MRVPRKTDSFHRRDRPPDERNGVVKRIIYEDKLVLVKFNGGEVVEYSWYDLEFCYDEEFGGIYYV